jgi:TRAP-type C4-dicarboxylate transport system permease small subunit
MPTNPEAKFSTRIKRIFEAFCGLLLFLAVTISMAEIVSRVVFKTSIDLLFDFSVWITVWAFLLIAGPLLPEGGHISIDFIRIKFSGRFRRLLEVCLALITLAYGALITWGGVQFLYQLYIRKSIFPRFVPIPKWIVQLCVPIGMLIFTIYAVICLVRAIREKW